MKAERWSGRAGLAWVVLALAVAGCGGSGKIQVTGKVTKGGAPLQVSPKTLVTLTFASEEGKAKQTYPAKFDQATGDFKVELPPGQYRANIVVAEPGRPFVSMSPESKRTVYDLSGAKEITVEISKK